MFVFMLKYVETRESRCPRRLWLTKVRYGMAGRGRDDVAAK